MKLKVLTRIVLFAIIGIFTANPAMAQLPELMYFKFNSSSSGNVANEADPSTRVSANGILNGATLGTPGQFGSALQGNGGVTSSNSLNAGWPLNLSTSWTISMWISGVTNTVTSNYVFGGSGGSTFRAMTGTGLVSGGGNIKVRSTGMTDIDLTGVFDATGTPVVVHIVYDKSAGQTLAYKNGVLLATVSQSTTLTFTGTDFTVGGYGTANGLPTGGRLDEFRMYNRALSASEITNTWNLDLNGCAGLLNLTYNSLTQTAVTLNWPAVSGSLGYEYDVTTSSTPPATGFPTTSVSVIKSGLSAGTTYYAHVRNKCGATNFSSWKTISFTTPICKFSDTIRTGLITDTSAMLSWNVIPAANNYEYILSTAAVTPPSTATGTVTPNAHVQLGGLQENTTYHFFLRSKCFASGDISDWNSLSFTTRQQCRPPEVIANLLQGSAVVSWDKRATDVGYEYAVNKYSAPPALGLPTFDDEVTVPLPDDGSAYYFHIRAKCYDMFTMSQWGTTQLRKPTRISDIGHNSSDVNIYPNPAKDRFFIEVQDGKGNVSITDITGRVVYQQKIMDIKTTVDISGWSNGIYLMKYNDGNTSKQFKVIKE